MAPSGVVFRMIASNCSGVCSRDWALMVALSTVPGTAGVPPSWPAETWAFWARIAAITSPGVRLWAASLSGSSQMRMAYWAPNSWMSPTPSTRLSGSCRLEAM